jgi:UDP-N-acetylmuramoylalanine-D-glutamate ligase
MIGPVVVLGMGKSGKAAVELLKALGLGSRTIS